MKQRPFLALWTLAVIATVAAFVLHLGLRGRTVDLGYKLGRARAEQPNDRHILRRGDVVAWSKRTTGNIKMSRQLLGIDDKGEASAHERIIRGPQPRAAAGPAARSPPAPAPPGD